MLRALCHNIVQPGALRRVTACYPPLHNRNTLQGGQKWPILCRKHAVAIAAGGDSSTAAAADGHNTAATPDRKAAAVGDEKAQSDTPANDGKSPPRHRHVRTPKRPHWLPHLLHRHKHTTATTAADATASAGTSAADTQQQQQEHTYKHKHSSRRHGLRRRLKRGALHDDDQQQQQQQQQQPDGDSSSSDSDGNASDAIDSEWRDAGPRALECSFVLDHSSGDTLFGAGDAVCAK
jgi:hypothetical protein